MWAKKKEKKSLTHTTDVFGDRAVMDSLIPNAFVTGLDTKVVQQKWLQHIKNYSAKC